MKLCGINFGQNSKRRSQILWLGLGLANPNYNIPNTNHVWLGGLVVSELGMRTRRPQFESRVTPLFHRVATLGKLFTHIASPVSQLQETGVQKGVFGPKWLWWLSASLD